MLPIIIHARLRAVSGGGVLLSDKLLRTERLKTPSRRWLTGTEVSTALRPFYFLVHPDLFGKYPKEQTENDKSLKILKNYVETLVHDKNRPNPKEVKFFVKPRGGGQLAKDQTQLPSIRIRLRDSKLRATVLNILKSAELPTGYVDAIPERKEANRKSSEEILSEQFEEKFEEHFQEQSKTGFSSTDKNQPLLGWLQANVDIARQRLSSHEPIRLETERLQVRLAVLKKIRLNCCMTRALSATSTA